MLKPLIYCSIRSCSCRSGSLDFLTRGEKSGDVSREELAALADIGAEEGVFRDKEAQLFKSLLGSRASRPLRVMTPRTVLVAFPETAPVSELVTPSARSPATPSTPKTTTT